MTQQFVQDIPRALAALEKAVAAKTDMTLTFVKGGKTIAVPADKFCADNRGVIDLIYEEAPTLAAVKPANGNPRP